MDLWGIKLFSNWLSYKMRPFYINPQNVNKFSNLIFCWAVCLKNTVLYIILCFLKKMGKFSHFILILANYPLNFERNNRFSVAILNFFDIPWSRFFEPIFFTNHYYYTWKISIKILKISQWVLKLLATNRFSAAILNF